MARKPPGSDRRAVAELWAGHRNQWFSYTSDADLSGADLEGADVGGANMGNAVLRGTNLKSAARLEVAKISRAIADTTTVWPAGFDPQSAGVVVI